MNPWQAKVRWSLDIDPIDLKLVTKKPKVTVFFYVSSVTLS